MSKKTNTRKHGRNKARSVSTKPRKRVRIKRPNPLKRDNRAIIDRIPSPFKDPIFLGHALSAILRYMELEYPFKSAGIDAEFQAPEAIEDKPE